MFSKKIKLTLAIFVLISTITALCGCDLVAEDGCRHVFGRIKHKIDLGEMGYCPGEIQYGTCFACEDIEIIPDYINLSCNFETVTNQIGTDENGNDYWKETSKCSSCGLVMETGEAKYKEQCSWTNVRAYRLSDSGDNTIVEGNYYSGDVDHEYEYTYDMFGKSCTSGVFFHAKCKVCGEKEEELVFYHLDWLDLSVNLSEQGMCGENSRFLNSSCPCGEQQYAGLSEEVKLNCHWKTQKSTYTDTSGNLHTVEDMYCDECDSRIFIDRKEIAKGCSIDYEIITKIDINGKTVVDDKFMSYGHSNQVVEYTYEMYGDSCNKGTNFITETCKKCGISGTSMFETDWHWHQDENSDYYFFKEYGTCGDVYFLYSECPCAEKDIYTYVNYGDDCNYQIYDTEIVWGENNEYEEIKTQKCLDCKISITVYEYHYNVSEHYMGLKQKYVFKKDDTVIFETDYIALN